MCLKKRRWQPVTKVKRPRQDIVVRNDRQTDRLFCSGGQGRNTAGEFLFDGGLIYERMRLCKRRASCDNVRWGWYLSIWADLQQPQRHKSCHPTVHLSVAGPTRLFGPDSWTGADSGRRASEARDARSLAGEGSTGFLFGVVTGASKGPQQRGPRDGWSGWSGWPGWGQSPIDWSGDGVTASAETAVR